MGEIVSVKNLSFSYGGNEAISNVSFAIEPGDFLVLVGHNGSGKTTLIKLLLGILKPTSGTISLFEKDIRDFSLWKKIGYLPQNIGLFNPLFPATVSEIVALGLVSQKKFLQRITKEDQKRISEAMLQMDIISLQNKLIGELSGGQIQRTILARAIVGQPDLLILDEPVSSVDTHTREEFFSYLARINKERKSTIVLITHDVGYSGQYANKMLYLDKRLLFYGTYGQFCVSKEMETQFGVEFQHIICHQH